MYLWKIGIVAPIQTLTTIASVAHSQSYHVFFISIFVVTFRTLTRYFLSNPWNITAAWMLGTRQRNRHCFRDFAHLPACRFSRVKKLASHRRPRTPSSCRTGPRDRPVHEVRGVCRGERYCRTRPSLMSQPTPCATATNRTVPGRDGTGRDGTGQDRLSLGIRTVNPGFYSPGIEVYSVLSRPWPCAPYPFAYVCLSYVQPSCGKTFAYLRSTTRCWPARVRGAQESLPLSPSFPPPFAAVSLSRLLDRRRFLGSVRHPPPLCPRNEIFVKNARFILTSPLPRIPPARPAPPYYSPRGLLRPVEY